MHTLAAAAAEPASRPASISHCASWSIILSTRLGASSCLAASRAEISFCANVDSGPRVVETPCDACCARAFRISTTAASSMASLLLEAAAAGAAAFFLFFFALVVASSSPLSLSLSSTAGSSSRINRPCGPTYTRSWRCDGRSVAISNWTATALCEKHFWRCTERF